MTQVSQPQNSFEFAPEREAERRAAHFGNHTEPPTDLASLQSTGPRTIFWDRLVHEHASDRQQSGTMRLGSLSAASAVLLPAQSYLLRATLMYKPRNSN